MKNMNEVGDIVNQQNKKQRLKNNLTWSTCCEIYNKGE